MTKTGMAVENHRHVTLPTTPDLAEEFVDEDGLVLADAAYAVGAVGSMGFGGGVAI